MRFVAAILISFFAFSAAAGTRNSDKYAALIINEKTGEVIFEKNADEKRFPASLTKIMTLYMTFEALKEGRLKINQMLTASKKAEEAWQTKIGLMEGEKISVEDCIKALIVRSANDCAVVLAESLQSSEMQFALAMTRKAREFGLTHTIFTNSSGLPDTRNFTTPREIMVISRAIKKDFPEYYNYFHDLKFYHGMKEFFTHNRITACYEGAEGMKTGFINMSGYNIISSVKRDGMEVIALVMGGESSIDRDKHMVELLDRIFVPNKETSSNIKPLDEDFDETCDNLAEAKENSENLDK